MDLGDMIRSTVELDESTRNALAKACEIKTNALQEIRDKLSRAFNERSRVSAADVINLVDAAIADYAAGSDPAYWSKPTD